MILFRCMMVEFARTRWIVRTVEESTASSNTSLYSVVIVVGLVQLFEVRTGDIKEESGSAGRRSTPVAGVKLIVSRLVLVGEQGNIQRQWLLGETGTTDGGEFIIKNKVEKVVIKAVGLGGRVGSAVGGAEEGHFDVGGV
jgi:hypothetical protein